MVKKLISMVSFSMLGTLSTFFFGVIMTHLLNQHDYGILSKWLTDLGFIGVFFTLGLGSSLMYYARKGQSIEVNMGKNFTIYSFFLLLGTTYICIYNSDEKWYLLTLLLTIYTFSINEGFRSYFQFKENFKLYNIFQPIRPILVLIVFTSLLFYSCTIQIRPTLFIYTVCSLITSLIIAFYYFKDSKLVFKSDSLYDYKYYTYGVKSILNTLLSLGLYSSCIYMLRIQSSFESIGLFFAASSISKVVWVVPDSAGNILYPKFLKAKTESDDTKVIEDMFYSAQVVFIINILVLIGFVILGKYIISLFYTDEYQSIYWIIIILLIGNQGMVYYKLISRYLASRNRWKPLYFSLIISVISILLLNYFLIPTLGVLGSAIASCISFWLCGITISCYIKNSFWKFLDVRKPIIVFYNRI